MCSLTIPAQENQQRRAEALAHDNQLLRKDKERLEAKIENLEFALATAEDMLRSIQVCQC